MNQDNVLQKAILSEKAYQLMPRGIYTFLVAKKATKNDVKVAIEKLFAVTVIKVNVSGVAPKEKKIAKTKKTVLVGGGKKAIVYLAAGQTIAALSPKVEEKSKKTKKSGEKDVEKTSVEGKEG